MNPTSLLGEGLWLSPTLLALDLGAAEKLLLAYLCQRASLTDETVLASNADIGQALSMKAKTVSEVINRLAQSPWLDVVIDKQEANKRLLTPAAALLPSYPANRDSPIQESRIEEIDTLTHYPRKPDRAIPFSGIGGAAQLEGYLQKPGRAIRQNGIGESAHLEDYTHFGYSPSADSAHSEPGLTGLFQKPKRSCRVTGVDISRQKPEAGYARQPALQWLAHSQPQTFLALVERLLPGTPVDLTNPLPVVWRLAPKIRKLALAAQSIEPVLPMPVVTPPLVRQCPITGLDISHQHPRHRFLDQLTLKRLAVLHPPTVQALATRFVAQPVPAFASPHWLIERIAEGIRQLGLSGESFEPVVLPADCPLLSPP